MMIHALVAVAVWTLALNHATAGVHLMTHGLGWLLTSRDDEGRPGASVLEQRMERVHRNHLENIMVFFPLAILAVVTGHGEEWLPAVACWVFLGARIAHLATYAGGVPPLRSLTHVAGLGVYAVLILVLLGVL